MKRHSTLLVLAALVGLPGPATADETTFCNAFITTLPFTITTQGHYCFNRNLSTAITTGNAITINVDYVVLDLNNFKLGGGSAGLGTNAVGVYSSDHRNITVRNGNIRGFKYGIRLVGTGATPGGLVVENNVLDGNTYIATDTSGDSAVIRNNLIANTGGTTTNTNWTYGIYANGGYGLASANDNVVTNTFQDSGNSAVGIYAQGADRNLVKMGSVGPSNYAIGITAAVCRDNTVLDNSTTWGLNCDAQVGDNYTNVP